MKRSSSNFVAPRLLQLSLPLLGFLVAGTPWATSAHAEPLSEMAYFNRCYIQITGKRPRLTHPSRAAIRAGTLTGKAACLQVLDKAKFVSGGANDGKIANPADTEAVDVLNHINDFHRSWFLSDQFETAVVDTNNALRRDHQIHDETEPALHVTRALFGNNVPYSQVVTQTSAMEGLRTSGTLYETNWDGTYGWSGTTGSGIPSKFRGAFMPMDSTMISGSGIGNRNTINATHRDTAQPVLNPQLVQTGSLLGVRLMTANAAKMALKSYSTSGAPISYSMPYPYIYFNGLIPFHESFGGGIVGTRSYLILNLGRPGSTFSDGGLDMPRRWAKALLSELLCRELPAIRDSDAAIYVQGNSTLPFRNSKQCMQCHASIDPLAGIARNMSIRPTPTYDYGDWHSSIQLAEHPVTAKVLPGWTDKDRDYYKRPPEGTLFFRSYSGERVNMPIMSVLDAKDAFSKLGVALSQTNDLYVCAAARYYQKFTGIKVNLDDPGNPTSLNLNLQDLKLRNEVIQLGTKLKTHQSLRTLIEDILNSPTYRQSAPAGDGS